MNADADPGGLALRGAAGDRQAFARLVRQYGPALVQLARASGTPESDVDDVVQDSFVAAWRALGDYDAGRPFRAWLFRIAINKIHDLRRHRRVRRFLFGAAAVDQAESPLLVDPAPGPERETLARHDLRRIRRILDDLAPEARDAIVLTAILGLSHVEAAEALGTSVKAVEGRVARARRRLALLVGEGGENSPAREGEAARPA